jgi:elongation factor 1-beta
MARVIVTLKVMPEGPEIDLAALEEKAKAIVSDFGGTIMSVEKQPIGYGIVALMVKFNMDEAKGSTEPIEELIRKVEGVESVDVAAISRAFG